MEIPTGTGELFNLPSGGSTGLWAQGEECNPEAAVTCGIPEWSFWAMPAAILGWLLEESCSVLPTW